MNAMKRMACAGLATMLAITTLAGCKGNDAAESGGEPNQEMTSSVEGEAAKGRYVETEIELPEPLKEASHLDSFKGKDGRLELVAYRYKDEGQNTEYFHYYYDGSAWGEVEQNYAQWAAESGIDIVKMTYGMDGLYYVGGRDDDYVFHLYQLQENGASVELLADVFKPQNGRTYGLSPDAIGINSKGEILISSQSEAVIYQADGTRLHTFPQDFSGSVDSRTMYVSEADYMTIVNNEIVRYSLENGQIAKTIPCSLLNSQGSETSGVLFLDDENGVYLAGETGVSHIHDGGTIWETLIDGSITALGMRSIYLNGFFAGNQDDFYGVFTSELGKDMLLYHYVYDPDVASEPPTILSIYALEDNSTIRQAASVLQKQNPDIRIDFRTADGVGDQTIESDIIRSLNTELLNGKGADILVLDGLPYEAYKEKGVLVDMNELFAEIHQKTPLLDSVVSRFTEEGGAVYRMPARIRVPVLYGDQAACQRLLSSMEDIMAYQGEKPLLTSSDYETLLRIVAHIYDQDLFGDNMEGLNQENLITYLNAVRIMGEKSGLTSVSGEEPPQNSVKAAGVATFKLSGMNLDELSFDEGLSACSIAELNSLSSSLLPCAILNKHPGMEFQTIHDMYIPSTMVGINAASGKKEAAAEFIQVLYSMEIQQVEFMDGFPVHKEALASWIDMDKDGYSVCIGNSDGSYTLGGEWPDKPQREMIIGLVYSLTKGVIVDETIMRMIIDGSKEYLEGRVTVEQASQAISQKVRLHLAE